MRHLLEGVAFEGNDPLVAVHMGALIDGHGEMTFAEQFARMRATLGDCPLEHVRIETRVAAQAIGRVEIDDDEVDRPIGLRLQDELALEFQRGADEGGQHHRFAQQPGDRLGVIVAAQDRIERLPEPDGAAAAIEAFQRKRDRDVVPAFGTIQAIARQVQFRHQMDSIPKTQQRIAFCMCKRFSASSRTTDCGPSMTSSVTSSPRWAGRQCMNRASGLARAIRVVSTR